MPDHRQIIEAVAYGDGFSLGEAIKFPNPVNSSGLGNLAAEEFQIERLGGAEGYALKRSCFQQLFFYLLNFRSIIIPEDFCNLWKA